MTEQKISQEELLENVTGFDELAVDKHFGFDLYLGDPSHPVMYLRSLIFVHRRHLGDEDTKAKAHALGMKVGDVNDYFADESDDFNPEEPDSDEGKGDSEPDAEPTTSRSSASSAA